MALGAGTQFVRRQPHRAHDAGVQRSLGVVRADIAGKGKAQIGQIVVRAGFGEAVQVDADQRRRREVVGGFFQHLLHAGSLRRLSWLEVPCLVVELEAVTGVLFDQQEVAGALDDGGHGDVGFPAVWHGRHYGYGA